MSINEEDVKRKRRRRYRKVPRKIRILIAFLMLFLVIFGIWLYYRLYRATIDHVQGDHEVTLERTELTILMPDENGYLKEQVIDVPEDFTESGGNIFGLESGTHFTPGCFTQAALMIANKDTVTFSYWIEIVFDKKTNEEFAKQLYMTVETKDGPISGYLSEGLTVGSEKKPMGTARPGEVHGVVIKIELPDNENNDLVKNAEVSFDVVIHTVSLTSS